jgi:HSP20 family protein
MALLTTYNPMVTLNTISDWMEQELSGLRPSRAPEHWYPAVDILEDDEAFTIKVELPGVEHDGIEMRIEESVLTVCGERKSEHDRGNLDVRRMERVHGKFERSFRLPDSADTDNVNADLKLGVLTIVVPKKEETKPRAIKVEVK